LLDVSGRHPFVSLSFNLFLTLCVLVNQFALVVIAQKATFEASQLETTGDFYATSLQGGLTSDGFNSIWACLMMSMPNTTFSQNNGVISMTKCASRRAGFACAAWMFLLGVFGKFAGIIVAIPDCVLGGMTIFLFANVLTSGINLSHNVDLDSRRNKFIFALSMAVGVGVNVWPFAFADMRASPYTAAFWTCADCGTTMQGLRNGISIFLSTGYCVGTVIAMILNAILPEDGGVAYAAEDDDEPNDVSEGDIEKNSKTMEVVDETEPNDTKEQMKDPEEEAPPVAKIDSEEVDA
jgi:xanthine/uracil permease